MAPYNYDERERIEKLFSKMAKKDQRQLSIIKKKIIQILNNPYAFKPLTAPMYGLRAVHIDKSFVLIYSIDEQTRTVIVEDYDHHDKIYGN
jgi:YafQ family addiction module toxin component